MLYAGYKPMSKLDNLIKTVVEYNPNGAVELAKNYNYPLPNSIQHPAQIGMALRHIHSKFGNDFLLNLGKIHPDKELIIMANTNSSKEHSNFCNACGSNFSGKGSTLGQGTGVLQYSGADGQQPPAEQPKKISDNMYMAILGVVAVISIIVIAKS